MKKTVIETIKEGLQYLPHKDQVLCEQFIKTRRIDSLKEIVDSTIIKINRSLKTGNNLQCEEDLENLNMLKNIVDEYYKACGYEEEDYSEDDLEIEDDEEYYGDY